MKMYSWPDRIRARTGQSMVLDVSQMNLGLTQGTDLQPCQLPELFWALLFDSHSYPQVVF